MRRRVMEKAIVCGLLLGLSIIHAGNYVFTVKGADVYLNDERFKVIGLRTSNALISDTKTQELIDNLDVFKSYGVNTVSVFFMGSRFGDIKGYKPDCSLDATCAARMGRIIEAADARGMVVLVGCLYWGTSKAKADLGAWRQSQANKAVSNTVQWLKDNNYRNVLVDPDNEGMSPWNVNDMIKAGHQIDNTVMIANNNGATATDADLNIHFGPKESEKPWLNSEATPTNAPGSYWGSYSKETHKKNGYYNYSRIGRYTSDMKENQLKQTRDGIDNRDGHILASTWIQCGSGEGVGGPFMKPGGHSNIADVDKNIDEVHSDAGILWWLEYVKNRYGAWGAPGKDTTSTSDPNGIHEKNRLVSFEAEDATRKNLWEPIDFANSCGKTMEDHGDGKGGYMEYDVDFATIGTWIVWVRHAKGTDGCAHDACNDCFAEMDGKDLFIYEGSSCADGHVIGLGTHLTSLGWQSRPKTHCSADRSGKHVAFEISSAGTHTFAIKSRSNGYMIDKFVFEHIDNGINKPSGCSPDATGNDILPRAFRHLANCSRKARYIRLDGREVSSARSHGGIATEITRQPGVYIIVGGNGIIKKSVQLK